MYLLDHQQEHAKKNFKLNNFVKIFIGKYFKKQQTTYFDVKYIKLSITKCLHIK